MSKAGQASANVQWPDQIWLVGDGYDKRRSSHNEEGAVAYVPASHYDELLEWARAMIVEGEVCPCGMPAPNKRAPLWQQPTGECQHEWAEGYGVPAYCKNCGEKQPTGEEG